MTWTSPSDAMPWVGLYICVASLVGTLAMAADVFLGFRQWKLWFPCKFFTINAASITLIAISTKLTVDLSTSLSDGPVNEIDAKFVSLNFLIVMLANSLPSLGLMNETELLLNTVALCILTFTVTVNVQIQYLSSYYYLSYEIGRPVILFIVLILSPISVALTVSTYRTVLQQRYAGLHKLASNPQEMNFSRKRLILYVKKYWMMTETGNPQFAIACSPVSFAFGVICFYFFSGTFFNLVDHDKSIFQNDESDYKWSVGVIFTLQSIGAIIGSIAPIFRCLTVVSHFNLSKKWIKHNINVFRVEKHWTQTLQLWKSIPVPSYFPGRHCKKVFRSIRNMLLNFCIALQIIIIVVCNIISLIPRCFLILLSYCYYCVKASLKRFKEEPSASNSNMTSDMKEYSGYVLLVQPEVKLSRRIIQNALKSITRLLRDSEEKEPRILLKLLEKSTGFNGVVQFDNELVPPLHPEETQNCWSLVTVTLTAIALALPKISSGHIKGLLSGMNEGLQLVKHIEETINTNEDLVKTRKAARRVWTDIEVYYKWLQIDLQKKAVKGKTSKEILEWLGDEAVKIVIQFKRRKHVSLDNSLHELLLGNSMYRISQTILVHCNKQENWPTDEELFEFISTIIADVLCACFTNLPRVITMKCHEDVIEKREESIRTAATLLGRSKKILKMLKARPLPNLDKDSMGYIDMWNSLPKDHMPNGAARSRPHSSSSNESLVVTII